MLPVSTIIEIPRKYLSAVQRGQGNQFTITFPPVRDRLVPWVPGIAIWLVTSLTFIPAPEPSLSAMRQSFCRPSTGDLPAKTVPANAQRG